MMDKVALRKKMKTVLKEAEKELPLFSYQAGMYALTLPAYVNAQIIMCYNAMRYEMNPSFFVDAASRAGKQIAYPVCIGPHTMQAYIPLDDEAWAVDAYGIRIPLSSRSIFVAPEQVDLIIVPGLAFDADGGRLGRGAAYYDNYLSQTNAYRVGFCSEIQLIDHLPMDQHDMRMHALATNTRVYYVKA